MRFSLNLKAIVLAFSAMLFIISCKEDSNMLGLSSQPPGEGLRPGAADTSTAHISTLIDDSSKVKGRSISWIGTMNDPETGKTEGKLLTQFSVGAATQAFSYSAFDSLVLSLPYYSYYGNLDQSQQFIVHELTTNLHADSTYNFGINEASYFTSASLNGSSVFIPKPSDSIMVGGVKVAPQVRIKLSSALGNKLLAASSTDLSTNANFTALFKGLYITGSSSWIGSSQGALLGFRTDSIKLVLYYKDSGGSPKQYTFMPGSSAQRVNDYDHIFTSTILSSIGTNKEYAYVQGARGLKTKLTFPYLKNLKEKKVVINKAELIIPRKDESLPVYAPMPAMHISGASANNRSFELPDKAESAVYVESSISGLNYTFNVTRYVNEIVNEGKDYSLILQSADSGIDPTRVIIDQKNIKLKLTLTKF